MLVSVLSEAKMTRSRLVQPWKALLTLVTEAGMTTDFRLVHPKKAVLRLLSEVKYCNSSNDVI